MFVFQMAKGADGQAKKALDEETRNTINSLVSQGSKRKIIIGAALELHKAGLDPEFIRNFIKFAAMNQNDRGINFDLIVADRAKALIAVANGKEDTFAIGAKGFASKEACNRVMLRWNSAFEKFKLEELNLSEDTVKGIIPENNRKGKQPAIPPINNKLVNSKKLKTKNFEKTGIRKPSPIGTYGYRLVSAVKEETIDSHFAAENRPEEKNVPKYIVETVNKNEEHLYDGKIILKMAANCVAIAKNKDEAKMLFIDSFDPAKITDAAKQMVELYLNDVQERGQLQQGFEGMAEVAEKFITEYEEQSENLAETSREVIGSFFEYWFSTKKAGSGKFSDEEPI